MSEDFITWLKGIEEKESTINLIDSFSKYHSKLYLNQVVIFFERLGISFTKTMIQNYVKIGLLMPLHEKRYYIKEHIIMLFFISSLKNILSLEDMKIIFKEIDDIENLYNLFLSTDIESIKYLNIPEHIKKVLFLILYYRNASITKNLINNL